jgi:hypothetical protein
MLDAVNDAQPLTRDDFGRLAQVLVAEAIPPPQRVWSDADWRLIANSE